MLSSLLLLLPLGCFALLQHQGRSLLVHLHLHLFVHAHFLFPSLLLSDLLATCLCSPLLLQQLHGPFSQGFLLGLLFLLLLLFFLPLFINFFLFFLATFFLFLKLLLGFSAFLICPPLLSFLLLLSCGPSSLLSPFYLALLLGNFMIFGVVFGFTVFEKTLYPTDHVANELLLLLGSHLLK